MDHGGGGGVSQVLELWAYSDCRVESAGCTGDSGTRCERERRIWLTVRVLERQLVLAHVSPSLSIRASGEPAGIVLVAWNGHGGNWQMCNQLEIGQGGSSYTQETGKCHKSGCFSPPHCQESQTLDTHPFYSSRKIPSPFDLSSLW